MRHRELIPVEWGFVLMGGVRRQRGKRYHRKQHKQHPISHIVLNPVGSRAAADRQRQRVFVGKNA